MANHKLKTWTPPYNAVVAGTKPFELRNNDRGYKVGDVLILQEWNEDTGYTGNSHKVRVTYVTDAKGPFGALQDGWVCMGIVSLANKAAAEDASLREVATAIVKKLDVTLTRLMDLGGFHALRAGAPGDYGPDPKPELEELRALLGLPSPAATERDFWPEDWCRHCDGSGKVMPTKGIHPAHSLQEPNLYLAGVRDKEEAVEILLGSPSDDEKYLTEAEARYVIDNLSEKPLYLKGHRIVHRDAWIEAFMEADATFVYIRECVWPVFDACPECKGTANRGLPEMEPWTPDPERGPWPEGEVIFMLDKGMTSDEFEDTWKRMVHGD